MGLVVPGLTLAVQTVFHVVGLVVLAALTTGTAAFIYRVRVRHPLPEGATLILGLGTVALYLNTRSLFVQFVQGGGGAPTAGEAVLNLAVFGAAAMASYAGHELGDRLARTDRLSLRWLSQDLSPIVRAAGRHITVTLPEEVADIDGYEPVTAETKSALAGRTMDFPRGLTVEALEAEVSTRLKEKFEVGHVDLDLAADGSVTYLGVARRPMGIGHSLPPGETAVALRADPPFSATAGDTVQIWRRTEAGPEKLGTAELRASVGDVVTVSGAPDLASAVEPGATYRLVTLPFGHRPDREFAAMLGRREETMRVLSLASESPLVGSSVAALAVTTLAIRAADGTVEPIPGRDRSLAAGDVLYVVGRPEPLRKLEATPGIAQVPDPPVEPDVPPVRAPGARTD